MKAPAILLVALALEASILRLLDSGLLTLVLRNLMLDRLLVPVVVLRYCNTILVANTAFAMLDGSPSKHHERPHTSVSDGTGVEGEKRRRRKMITTY